MPDVLIPDATTAAFVPRPEDVGKNLYCRVRAQNDFGIGFSSSVAVGPVGGAPLAPASLTAPNIADLTPGVGEALHTTDGTWAGVPAPTFSYEWHRVTVVVPAAPTNLTAPNITEATPEVDETLHVTDGTWGGVPAPTFGYQWHRVTPDPVAPSGGIPSIADTTPVEGETLHCAHGTWTGDPTITFAYQWKRNSTNVGTSSADYLLVAGDVGASMTCVVTATNSVASVPATSNAVGPVTAAAAPPVNTGAPSIADITPEVAEILHVTDGTWTGFPAPTFAYQWFQIGTAAVITSSATATNVENTVLAHALTADQSVTWTKVGGADNAKFTLTGAVLSWTSTTKNFEVPDDADTNNAYVVIVRATATTGQTTDQTVTVTVSNVAEASLTFDFTANTSTIAGAASTAVAPLTITRAGAAFYAENLSGVWTSFGANVARRTDKGLLIEEARTNVVLRNRDFTNASWVKTNCTALKDQTGIDGVASAASKLTATAANATCLLTTTISSSPRWQTAFIKRITGTGNVQMTMDNGTTWTTVTITSSWARYAIPTQTLANPVVGFRIVTSGDVIAVDFVQNENGVFATSPIPTTTAAVTRAADVIVINTAVASLASWFNEPAGTLYAEGNPYTAVLSTSIVFQIDSGTAANYHFVGIPGVGFSNNAGSTQTASSAQGLFSAAAIAGVNKSAWAYAANNMAGSLNGAAVVTDTSGTMPTGLTTTRIGKPVAASSWSGYLRKITYYGERLSDADLVTLTTP